MLQAIILGAGSSKFFTKNTANIPVNCAKTVLDWQTDAFSGKDATFTFVGGNQIEHLSHEGSDVHFVFNPQWESSSCAASLRLSDFNTENSAFVCYADVLFRRSLVDKMLAESRDDCGIVVAVDLDLSLLKTKEDYETICIDKIHYPFVGCVYFRPQALKNYQIPHPDVRGKETIFGVMPDWNPAEIVGTKPKRLAISLYQSLITNDIWAQQRAEFGYKDVQPYPLIVNFVGHPYVDVRASVHSFLPNVLSDEATEKLVDYFVGRLKQNPAWHDKLEFMVMPTCYTVDFEDRWYELLTTEAGLSEEEFLTYKEALLTLTKNAFEICERCYAEMQTIERRFDRIDASDLQPLDKIYVLLQTCRAGTLNFSHLARCGFIASSFLKSFVAKGLLTEEEKMQITGGIKTVTGQFFDTVRKALNGEISKEACVRTYGHLRPGTYDITSPAYCSDPNKYLFSVATIEKEPPKTEKRYIPSKSLECMLRGTFGVSRDEFYRFISHAVAGREYSKFIFTRYISKVLDLIKAIGEEYGFDAEAMSHVPVDLVEDIRNGLYSRADIASLLKTIIAQGKEYNLITQSIELPPLITKAEDFYAFFIPKTLPNFIGNGTIEAEVVYLEHSKTTDGSLLSGKIVLIEQADPGFDWIFNYNIGGLITAYGGPNSHMSIRASEFNLPASIGVGESLFNKLKFARLVRLDCGAHQLTVLG